MQVHQPGTLIQTVAGWPAVETLLPLTPGEQVTAFVQAARDNSAVLYLKGAWVPVRHQGLLQEGASVQLLVAGRQPDGSWLLKLLPGPGGVEEVADPGRGWPQLLTALEIEPTPTNLLLARELASQGLPLTAEGLNLLSRAGGTLPVTPERIPALVWLWARGLPLSSGMVELAAQHLANPLLSGEQETWQGFLGRLLSREWPPAISENISQAQSLLEQVTLRQGDGREAAAAKLATLAQTWGLNYESRLAALLTAGHRLEGEHATAFRELVRNSLKPLLLALEGLMLQEGEPGLAHSARHLSERVAQMQLVNAGEQQSGNPGVVLQGLVMLREQEVPFYLKLKKHRREERAAQGQGASQVMVYLATPRLGQVMGRLVLAEGSLTCGLTVERPAVERLFNRLLPHLRSRLEQLPWRINLLPCRLQHPGAIFADGIREFGSTLPREGLDVLV